VVTCGTVRELLLDDVGAALSEDERQAVAAHLAACQACREEEAALRWADRALAPLAAPAEAPPADPSALPWLRARRPVWWWAAAAALAAGVLALALLLPQRQAGTPTPAQANRRQTAAVVLRPAPARAPELPEPSAAGQDRRAAAAPESAGAAVAPERRRRGRGGSAPSGAAEQPVSIAIVIVEPGTAPPLRSSYQAEVALPGGAASSLTQRISRDQTGTPREITIAYARRAEARPGE
jgi:hypothetical protein